MQSPSHVSVIDAPPRTGACTSEEFFASNLPLIDRVIKSVARRHRVPACDADDFASTVYLRLIKDDYRILRKLARRGSLGAFLHTVIHRIYLDGRTEEWGRWRPSAEARRQGATAVLFEKLLLRDELSIDQAVEVLKDHGATPAPRAALAAIAARAPVRSRRPVASTELAESVADPAPLPDASIARRELREYAIHVSQAVERALAALKPRDRLLIELHFGDGLSIAQIARELRIRQRTLYHRLPCLLRQLRRDLEAELVGEIVHTLVAESWADFEDLPRIGLRA